MNPKKELTKYVPVNIGADTRRLSHKERRIIDKLIQVAKLLDEIFFDQVYHRNKEILAQLEKNPRKNMHALKLFRFYYGPFDRLRQNKTFIDGYIKPKGSNFYPEDMTVQEFEEFIKRNPDIKNSFQSSLTLIRRINAGLVAISYSDAYKEELTKAAALLRESAKLSQNRSLKKYFNTLASSFISNDYFESDVAWIDIKNNKIEPLFGPFEVYEDDILGLKASFEAIIGIKDEETTNQLKIIERHVNRLEKNLPIPDKYKSKRKGKATPIVVIDEILSGGDARAGVHMTAFNLPNDEKVKQIKGSKKVLIKNVAQAKYDNCFIPILEKAFFEQDILDASFDAYFTHTLLHEVSHGLGPGIIIKGKQKITVNRALKNKYSAIEEAKADVLGVHNAFYLIDKGIYPKEFERQIVASFIGGIFRSIRFGTEEAHAIANLAIFNFLKEKKIISYRISSGKFKINHARARSVFKSLSNKILMIQAKGSYDDAKKFLDKYAKINADMKKALEGMKDIPIDILPIYRKDFE
ncbi:MAG: dipeptidyl-peptidase 3 family protein [Candidatus Nanoarchaeia archaeon]